MDFPCNASVFADDVAILAPTISGINNYIYGIRYSARFNPSKSKIILFSNWNLNRNTDIKIDQVNEHKYLGFDISNSRYFYNIEHIINDMKVRANAIKTNLSCLD